MKILFIAPLPPPFTGNSLPVKLLSDELKEKHEVSFVDVNKNSHKSGITSIGRIVKICFMLLDVWRRQKKYDVIYLTVAESFAGNCRDLAIYWICRKRLNSIVIHMLGGAAMKDILTPNDSIMFKINKYFVSKLGNVIVEGAEQRKTFANVIALDKIHIINNFAEDFLFVSEHEVNSKFQNISPLKVLFLSNMLEGKGHMELLRTFLAFPPEIQEKFHLDFAGKFLLKEEEDFFRNNIAGRANVVYHGSVSGEYKKKLFKDAHVFCLPTYYPFEGQPFCIVESYATGCFVITTNHSGIRYIFSDEINGKEVEKMSIESLSLALLNLLSEKEKLMEIGLSNLKFARQKFTSSKYLDSMKQVFNKFS